MHRYLIDAATGERNDATDVAYSLTKPVENDSFKLGAGRTGSPREADTTNGVRQHVTQDTGVAVAGGEVGVETRVLPVRHL